MLKIPHNIGHLLRRFGVTAHTALGHGANLLFPPECVHCQTSLVESANSIPFCISCWTTLFPQLGPVCERCGAPVPEHLSRESCRLCSDSQFHFEWVRGLGIYDGELAALIHRMKEVEHQAISLAAGRLLAREFAAALAHAKVELIAPLPMHWLRRLTRGVNSPDLVSETLSGSLGLPVAYDLLRTRRMIERQGQLTPRERRRNVRGAFGVSWAYNIKGARIALVDDVLTTGATASEAAWALKQAGAEAVVVVVVARGIGD